MRFIGLSLEVDGLYEAHVVAAVFFGNSLRNKMRVIRYRSHSIVSNQYFIDFVAMYFVQPDWPSCCFILQLSFFEKCVYKITNSACFCNKDIKDLLHRVSTW